MAKNRGKHRRQNRSIVPPPPRLPSVAAASQSTALAFDEGVDLARGERDGTSYIRELRGEPSTPSTPSVSPVEALDGSNDATVDEFERRLLSPAMPGRSSARFALVAVAVGVLAAGGWIARSRMQRSSATPPVARIVRRPAIVPAAVVIAPAPVVAAAPAAPVGGPIDGANATLDTNAVDPQPTVQLTDLLQAAVRARSESERAAADAMQTWIDAGGTDAVATAQFAYWLGHRNYVRLAEQWAERATVMDPNSQMAWYVLGATRLDDPHQSRSAAIQALRHCAMLPGSFVRECVGPLANPAAVFGVPQAHTTRETASRH